MRTDLLLAKMLMGAICFFIVAITITACISMLLK